MCNEVLELYGSMHTSKVLTAELPISQMRNRLPARVERGTVARYL